MITVLAHGGVALTATDGRSAGMLAGHARLVVSTAVSRDGHFLVTTALDRTVRLWELPGRALLRTYPPDRAIDATDAVLTPDGRYQVAGRGDGTLEVFPATIEQSWHDACADVELLGRRAEVADDCP